MAAKEEIQGYLNALLTDTALNLDLVCYYVELHSRIRAVNDKLADIDAKLHAISARPGLTAEQQDELLRIETLLSRYRGRIHVHENFALPEFDTAAGVVLERDIRGYFNQILSLLRAGVRNPAAFDKAPVKVVHDEFAKYVNEDIINKIKVNLGVPHRGVGEIIKGLRAGKKPPLAESLESAASSIKTVEERVNRFEQEVTKLILPSQVLTALDELSRSTRAGVGARSISSLTEELQTLMDAMLGDPRVIPAYMMKMRGVARSVQEKSKYILYRLLEGYDTAVRGTGSAVDQLRRIETHLGAEVANNRAPPEMAVLATLMGEFANFIDNFEAFMPDLAASGSGGSTEFQTLPAHISGLHTRIENIQNLADELLKRIRGE